MALLTRITTLLTSVFLACICFSETYQLANRAGRSHPRLSGERATLPHNIYTNTIQWLTGDHEASGIISEDFSPNELDANITGSNCVVLDGLVDVCSPSNARISGDFSFHGWYKPSSTNIQDVIYGFSGNGLRATGFRFQWRDAGNSETLGHITVLLANSWYYVEADRVGTNLTLAVTPAGGNRVAESFTTAAATISTPAVAAGGSVRTEPKSLAEIYYAEATPSIYDFHYTFAGGLGAGTVEYDTSDNGNHGTWTTGAGGTTTLRSGTQDVFHPNLINGCSKVLVGTAGNTSWANLGIIPTATMRIEVDAKFLSTTINKSMFGCYDGTDYLYLGISAASDFQLRNGNSGWKNLGAADTERHLFTFDMLGGTMSVDDTSVASASTVFSANACYLFSLNVNGTPGSGGADCEVYSVKVYDNNVLTKSWYAKDAYGTTLPDSTGTNNATLVNTSFNYLPADASDPTKDVLGNTLTNPGGYVHNNFEGFIEQDSLPPATIIVTGTLTLADDTYTQVAVYEGKGEWSADDGIPHVTGTGIWWTGSNWRMSAGTGFLWLNTNDTLYPDTTGWGLSETGDPEPTVVYNYDNDFWYPDGLTAAEIGFSDLIEHYNLDNHVAVVGASPLISDIITQSSGTMLTPATYISYSTWLAAQDGPRGHLVPYEVTGGGIGPSNTWYTADGTNVYLIEYVGE